MQWVQLRRCEGGMCALGGLNQVVYLREHEGAVCSFGGLMLGYIQRGV